MNKNTETVSRKKAFAAVLIAFIAGLLLMLLALEVVVPWIAALKAPAYGSAPQEINPNTPEWYTYERTYSDKHALIDIDYSENPVKPTANDDFEGGYGWFYTVYLTEMNGFDFYPENYQEVYFSDGYAVSEFTYTADDMIMWWGDDLIASNERLMTRGGLPLQDLSGLGIKVSGKDSTGEVLEFYGYLEFSQEISE